MTVDILRRIQRQNPSETVEYNEAIFNEAFNDLDNRVKSMGGSGVVAFGLPQPDVSSETLDIEYVREINYDVKEMAPFMAYNEHKLNEDHETAFIITRLRPDNPDLVFLSKSFSS
ncbi:Hypothetical predicted protein [Octopus vulgaris]|uniref:Uncharacterized protein n=1 Tax=Octopus vulgaris TaxID=6645 RepID=A0AA36FD36_OCTVU|nr:Hypothetical predicted protein [Octopus vulgaris]